MKYGKICEMERQVHETEKAKMKEDSAREITEITINHKRKIDVIIQDPAYANPKVDVTDDVIKALNSLK